MADCAEVVEVARRLVRVVAVQQQTQRIRIALQVLPVHESPELFVLLAQTGFQFARLSSEAVKALLQFAPLLREAVQRALC